MSEKTVFISYRRDSIGSAFAGRIQCALKKEGYDVFVDVNSLGSGNYEEKINRAIPKKSHFLLIVTPNSLDDCSYEDDWIKKELILAYQTGRNIVPIYEESIDENKVLKNVDEDVTEIINRLNYIRIRHNGFDQDIQSLTNMFIADHHSPEPFHSGEPIRSTPLRVINSVRKDTINISVFLSILVILSGFIAVKSIQTYNMNSSYLLVASLFIFMLFRISKLPKEDKSFAIFSLTLITLGTIMIIQRDKSKIVSTYDNSSCLCLGIGAGIGITLFNKRKK